MTHDAVNRPSHYAEGRQYEPIAVIEDWELSYHLGNALKYISRAGRKDDIVQDLRKAAWYLDREIERQTTPVPTPQPAPVEDHSTNPYRLLVEDRDALYRAVCWADKCNSLWDPTMGPIEPDEDCVCAAQPVELYEPTDTLDFSLLREDVLPNVEETPIGFRAGLYDNPYS